MSTPRYRNLGDGTIRDTDSGLYWMAAPLGFPETGRRRWRWPAWLRRLRDGISHQRHPTTEEPAGLYPWEEAWRAVEAFNQAGGCGGYQDGRWPNRGELKTLLDRPRHRAAFPVAIKGRYWTCWPHRNPRYAWFVDFDTGQTGYLSKDARLQVRLVRRRGT